MSNKKTYNPFQGKFATASPSAEQPTKGKLLKKTHKTNTAPKLEQLKPRQLGLSDVDPDMICSASMDQVNTWSFFKILMSANQLVIPLSQRRYCWFEGQWNQLLVDLVKITLSRDHTVVSLLIEPQDEAESKLRAKAHNFGRIQVCYTGEGKTEGADESESGQRVERLGESGLIVDGQQRATTLSLLLATLRDLSTPLPLSQALSPNPPISTYQEITTLLCPKLTPQASSSSSSSLSSSSSPPPLSLRESLTLIPTYLDRYPFYQATFPDLIPKDPNLASVHSEVGSGSDPSTSLISQAKRYFMRALTRGHHTPQASISCTAPCGCFSLFFNDV